MGGGLSLINVAKVQITDTIFDKNYANNSGGAIYFSCSKNFATNLDKCSLNIEGTRFINNLAQVEGGAIKWDFFEPTMINNEYQGNSAGVYGDKIASVANKLI